MNCRECKEHLYEYLDRELTPAVEQEIRQHIADCPPCGDSTSPTARHAVKNSTSKSCSSVS